MFGSRLIGDSVFCRVRRRGLVRRGFADGCFEACGRPGSGVGDVGLGPLHVARLRVLTIRPSCGYVCHVHQPIPGPQCSAVIAVTALGTPG